MAYQLTRSALAPPSVRIALMPTEQAWVPPPVDVFVVSRLLGIGPLISTTSPLIVVLVLVSASDTAPHRAPPSPRVRDPRAPSVKISSAAAPARG